MFCIAQPLELAEASLLRCLVDLANGDEEAVDLTTLDAFGLAIVG